MKPTKPRISVDDGCASDVRIAELADKYDIEAIFYWPVEWHSVAFSKGYKPLSYEQAEEIAFKHEIGAHGITHRILTEIPLNEAFGEIKNSGIMLENLFGGEISKFCFPRGYTNQELSNFTLDYYDLYRLTKGKHLVHIHPNSGANNNKPWQECINPETTELWCHSWELDKYNLWEELEKYLENTYS